MAGAHALTLALLLLLLRAASSSRQGSYGGTLASSFRDLGDAASELQAVPSGRDQTLISEYGLKQTSSAAGMEVTLSEKGITYAKDVLVQEVLAEMTPMHIPDVEVSSASSWGTVTITLTNVNLSSVYVAEAAVALAEDADTVTIFAEGVSANATLKWAYTYADWVGDSGSASVQVVGMQAGVTFNLTAYNGTLKMGIVEHGVVIEKLDITMYGGVSSWLYNWLIYAFTNHLRAAVESAVNSGVVTAALKLDNYLQTLPRRIAVDSTAAIDATVKENPVVAADRLSVSSRCEFTSVNGPIESKDISTQLPDGVLCGDTQKMVTIALTDFVVNSAAQVYYEAGRLAYEVDELPASSPIKLNTGSWRFLLPSLYLKYPNRNMLLDFNTSAPPNITFAADKGVKAEVAADMTILVILDDGSRVGVACLGMEVYMEGRVEIKSNNLTGAFLLDDLELALKWSTIGNFPIRTLQTMAKTAVKNVVLPILNRRMVTGFPLPVLPGVELEEAALVYGDQYLLICSDVKYTGGMFSESGEGGEDMNSWFSIVREELHGVAEEASKVVEEELPALTDWSENDDFGGGTVNDLEMTRRRGGKGRQEASDVATA